MLTPALPLDMAFDSTSMACDLALPIVALLIVALPVVTLPVFVFRGSSSTSFIIINESSGARLQALRRRAVKDRRWVTILAPVSAFSVSSSVDAKVRHSSVFGRLDMM